jgi:hypothetical protein
MRSTTAHRHIANLAAELWHHRGIADMAGIAAGSAWSRINPSRTYATLAPTNDDRRNGQGLAIAARHVSEI